MRHLAPIVEPEELLLCLPLNFLITYSTLPPSTCYFLDAWLRCGMASYGMPPCIFDTHEHGVTIRVDSTSLHCCYDNQPEDMLPRQAV